MPTFSKHEHGTFSWLELATTDAPAAKKFYSGLFGWSYDDQSAGPDMVYTMCKLGNQYVAALYAIGGAMAGTPPHWSSYITVADVDATARAVKANGGALLKDPFDVMDVGRMAVAKDPTGAAFCLWTARKHIGAGVRDEPGALCWNELYTTDTAKAGNFYKSTLGWSLQAVDMGPMGTYTLFKRPGASREVAGMMAMLPHMKGVPPHWLGYFGTRNCDQSAGRIQELGGKVNVPPTDIPNVGRFAVAHDPQGAVFAIFQGAG